MKKPALYLLLEIALCLLFAVLPLVLALWPQDVMMFFSVLLSRVAYPVIALCAPLLAARRGAAAFLCAIPPFILYLLSFTLLGLALPALPALLTLIFSILGANIGAELHKRTK